MIRSINSASSPCKAQNNQFRKAQVGWWHVALLFLHILSGFALWIEFSRCGDQSWLLDHHNPLRTFSTPSNKTEPWISWLGISKSTVIKSKSISDFCLSCSRSSGGWQQLVRQLMESQNHGRDLKTHPAMGRDTLHWPSLLQALSWNTSRDGKSPTSLENKRLQLY